MDPILDQLYYGRYTAQTRVEISPEYQACSDAFDAYCEQAEQVLGSAFWREMYAAMTELCDRDALHFYKLGVRLGMRLALEVFGSESVL